MGNPLVWLSGGDESVLARDESVLARCPSERAKHAALGGIVRRLPPPPAQWTQLPDARQGSPYLGGWTTTKNCGLNRPRREEAGHFLRLPD